MRYKKTQLAIIGWALGAVAISMAHAQPALPPTPLPLPSDGVAPPAVELPQSPLPPLVEAPQGVAPPPMPPAAPAAVPLPVPPPQASGAQEKTALGNLIGGVNKVAGEQAPVPVVQESKVYSYGLSNLSILFLPEQIERMKASLRTFEDTATEEVPTTFAEPTPTTQQVVEKITEPNEYPVFFLSSIVYNAPGDWSLWVSGHKITSRKNNTDLQVISVTRDSATFTWSPSYHQAITRRKETKQFASTDEIKNKLAANQAIIQDEQTKAITFTLRQNQTFVVGYYSIFEGYIESPKLAPLTLPMQNGMQQGQALDNPAGNLPPGMAPGMNPDTLPPGMNPEGAIPEQASTPMPPSADPNMQNPPAQP